MQVATATNFQKECCHYSETISVINLRSELEHFSLVQAVAPFNLLEDSQQNS